MSPAKVGQPKTVDATEVGAVHADVMKTMTVGAMKVGARNAKKIGAMKVAKKVGAMKAKKVGAKKVGANKVGAKKVVKKSGATKRPAAAVTPALLAIKDMSPPPRNFSRDPQPYDNAVPIQQDIGTIYGRPFCGPQLPWKTVPSQVMMIYLYNVFSRSHNLKFRILDRVNWEGDELLEHAVVCVSCGGWSMGRRSDRLIADCLGDDARVDYWDRCFKRIKRGSLPRW